MTLYTTRTRPDPLCASWSYTVSRLGVVVLAGVARGRLEAEEAAAACAESLAAQERETERRAA